MGHPGFGILQTCISPEFRSCWISIMQRSICTRRPGASRPEGIANAMAQLKAGELGNFFAALKLIAKRRQTSDPALSPERSPGYFEENRTTLGYAEALRRKLPIGSGVVESAARHIVLLRRNFLLFCEAFKPLLKVSNDWSWVYKARTSMSNR